jgi:hypothetical protein
LEDRVFKLEYLEAVAVVRLRVGVVHNEGTVAKKGVVAVDARLVREVRVRERRRLLVSHPRNFAHGFGFG